MADEPSILILDDDKDVLEMLLALFRGWKVVGFEHGLDALIEIFSGYKQGKIFDLLLLDCALPHFDAFTIARFVRRAEETGIVSGRSRIAVFTAYAQTVEQTTLLEECEIDAYWRKPEDTIHLPDLVRDLLSGADVAQ